MSTGTEEINTGVPVGMAMNGLYKLVVMSLCADCVYVWIRHYCVRTCTSSSLWHGFELLEVELKMLLYCHIEGINVCRLLMI